jgi:hypothetical protein
MSMMPEQVRFSLTELLRNLHSANLECNNAIIQAPGIDRFGLDFLGALTGFTAVQTQRVLEQATGKSGWDATLPELTPDLSKNLAERMRARREALARREAIRGYRLH